MAVGVTGQGDGCWLVTAEVLPVRSAIYGRTKPGGGAKSKDWFTDGTAASAFSVNGSVVFPGAQAAILHWLKRKEPEVPGEKPVGVVLQRLASSEFDRRIVH